MAETIYADQVTNISIQNGIVRLELAVVDELPKTQNEQIKMRVSHHLVLPLNAFVKAFEIEQTMMNKLVQDGVLKPTEKAPTPTAG
jgi:hypothetical protein